MDGLTLGSIYALIALGYTLVYGVLRLINFAHSEIFALGIFATTFAIQGMGIDAPRTGWSLVGTLLILLARGDVHLGSRRVPDGARSPTGASAGATHRASPR